jgi:hypothetical protein
MAGLWGPRRRTGTTARQPAAMAQATEEAMIDMPATRSTCSVTSSG